MPPLVPTEYLTGALSLLLILGGIVWRSLIIRIDNLEIKHANIPVSLLLADIAVIKRDIDWIKSLFADENYKHGKVT